MEAVGNWSTKKLVWHWHADALCIGCAALLVLAAFAAPSGLAAFLLFFGSGIPLATVLRSRYTLSEFMGVAVACSLMALAGTAVVGMALGVFRPPLAIGFPVALSLALAWKSRKRRLEIRLAESDLVAAAIAALVCAGAGVVYLSNGPIATTNGSAYLMRHWIARDGAYFFALVQEAAERGAYPRENPFMAGLNNDYAALGHCGFALLALVKGEPAAFALWGFGLILHSAATVLLAHTMFRAAYRKQTALNQLWLGGAVATVVLWRADFFVYPQSQSYFLPLLFLFLWWTSKPGWWRLAKARYTALAGAFILTGFHTVSAAVALCLLLGFTFGDLRSLRKLSRHSGIFWFGGLALTAVSLWFFGGTPFGPRFTKPGGFAIEQVHKHALTFLPLYLTAIWAAVAAWRKRARNVSATLVLLCGAGIAYSLEGVLCADPFSQFFAIFNAQRFPYFALPLALGTLLSLGNTSRFIAMLLTAGGLVFCRPQVLREVPKLITADPLVFTTEDLRIYDYIRGKTPPDARFISDAGHEGLPAFTGRASFARGPVPLFGLHSLPENEMYQLFFLREAFLTPQQTITAWAVIHAKFGVNYVLIENAKKPENQEVIRQLLSLRTTGGRFVPELETSRTVLLRWNSPS